jgi:hypothetical protein
MTQTVTQMYTARIHPRNQRQFMFYMGAEIYWMDDSGKVFDDHGNDKTSLFDGIDVMVFKFDGSISTYNRRENNWT